MSENENGLIMLTADDGSEEAFFVLEKADIAGVSYLLVTDSVEDEEAEAMILREETEDELVTYQVVDDEKELKIISKYLEELLDDVELRLEWKIVALYIGKTRQKVKRAAPGGEGYVMNHLSKKAVKNYLSCWYSNLSDCLSC